ncbi:unnamed protein product, partial [Arabidopsis halleri]
LVRALYKAHFVICTIHLSIIYEIYKFIFIQRVSLFKVCL